MVAGRCQPGRAGGTPILQGRLRDYTPFAGFPDPYETPNLIFLGDDTSSAAARVRLERVTVTIPLAGAPYRLYLPVMRP